MSLHTKIVTVGIPTYNRADKLERSILSVLKQDYAFLEILISNNSSTDDTHKICQQFCEKDERVKYIKQSSNIGASENFKAVLEQASGDFFMWLGDDDWIEPAYISSCVSLLESDSGYSLVSGSPIYYRDDKRVFDGKVFNLIKSSWVFRVVEYYMRVADNGMFYGVMRLPTIRQVGLRNNLGGDWHMLANIASIGSIRMLPSVSVHRELGGATSSYYQLAKSAGLPRIQAIFPMITVASGAWKEITYKGQLFRRKNILSRLLLANVVFVVVAIKSVRGYLGLIKKFLKPYLRKFMDSQ